MHICSPHLNRIMVIIKKFVFNPFQENTYVIHNHSEALVIDPGMYLAHERKEFDNYINTHQLTLKQVLLTHAHIDHILGCQYLFKNYGLSPALHSLDIPLYQNMEKVATIYEIPNVDPVPEIYQIIQENTPVSLGNISIEIRHVPGHSPGHLAYILHEQRCIFSGDVLFSGSIGRTDLPGGSHEQLLQNIKTHLFSLPDNYKVYCGHGPETTIGFEKENNPFVGKNAFFE